ncbi:MAG: recombinase family protein [Mesorhizobium sp.]|uniref:recombinase family protein n=1 Tax=unclassified Mesorhizobium TaxID=325217 RepID=UPI0010933AC0|nr:MULTISPECIES: recombinase family protein [unclassified Mesorhizobium]TGS85032.1 recombinase family protein [Mesorhizobium sp. M3A.F.Ca.ET.175.01.1.1]TGT21749.1 recombinase family protein [Mesorhizobium sp. M3A.F.Ca.ET.174.01.1.1]TIW05124.1 MAG: recombinase family protein [Mesorhizobium sp.]
MPDLKVTADHLRRDAYLYIRQSTLRQVAENGESTQRQYGLRDRAIAAGWPVERVHVIDCDLGKSGSSAVARDGFQELVSEVALAKAGVVMGLEVSRLARNSADWHRLLELCALTSTLILDEDGVYDPASFNDRLLLGLKGTMSEAELHFLKARMRGGQLNKASRGDLKIGPPVGLVYLPDGTLALDPDAEVQAALRMVFTTFERLGSATRTVKFFLDEGILLPRRLRKGPHKGELMWAPPRHARILQVLHNPRYAGAFVYGRTRGRPRPGGGVSQIKVDMADWRFVMPDLHPGYIDWERFKANQERLAANAQAYGMQRRAGPVREGSALLQGRVLCGLCGGRMGVHYSQEHGQPVPTYICQETATRRGGKVCQSVPGKVVDPAVGALLVELMAPMTLEVTLAVQRELEARAAEMDTLRRQHIERTRHDAELARRRYMKVDPDNRLVADTLEAEWNEKLRLHTDVVEDYERRAPEEAAALDAVTQQRVRDLAEQFPRIWSDPRIDVRERKRILRLLVADVTLVKAETITANVRLSGGATRTLTLERPLPIAQIRKFKPELVAKVDRLLDRHCDREIADILNEDGLRTWEGKPFNLKKIAFIRGAYNLPSRRQRLRDCGLLTTQEAAEHFAVAETTVHQWGRRGLITKVCSDSLNRGLWDIPHDLEIIKGRPGRNAVAARRASIAVPSTEQDSL